LTEKLRVFQVAKDFNVSSEALIGILQGLGVSAKSHMSTQKKSRRATSNRDRTGPN